MRAGGRSGAAADVRTLLKGSNAERWRFLASVACGPARQHVGRQKAREHPGPRATHALAPRPQVGTSFTAFRNQPNGCSRAPGTCLGGQLADLYADDEARIASGLVPLYSVKQFSYGTGSSLTRWGVSG